MELKPDAVELAEASIALETTARSVRENLQEGHANYSLCHGLCGNAEVLLEGVNILPTGEALARGVATNGVQLYGDSPTSFPCGVPGGMTPNLLLGLAGIGHFYLRLAFPEVPSVVLLRP